MMPLGLRSTVAPMPFLPGSAPGFRNAGLVTIWLLAYRFDVDVRMLSSVRLPDERTVARLVREPSNSLSLF
jgi:hypothetical protein